MIRASISFFGFFLTCLPIFIPVVFKFGPKGLLNINSYKICLRDLLFVIVATASIGAMDLATMLALEHEEFASVIHWLLGGVGVLMFILIIALVHIGAEARTTGSSNIEAPILAFYWFVAIVCAVVPISFKYYAGLEASLVENSQQLAPTATKGD